MDQLFQTQNRALACCLATCGAQIPKDDNGNPVPCIHLYDKKTLERLGYKGWKAEAAVRDAIEKHKTGIIVYQFVRCDLLNRILVAWDKHAQLIAGMDQQRGGIGSDISTSLAMSEEDVARICCQFAKNNATLSHAWKTVHPLISVSGPQTTSTGERGEKIIQGSFKAASLNASKETKRRAGL